MDERVFVSGRGNHGLEVGDGDGNLMAVEADDEAA